jgi:hypothetical protein
MLLFAHDQEAALGEHPHAGDVVLGDSGVRWALGHLRDKIGERSRRTAAAPVRATNPVSDARSRPRRERDRGPSRLALGQGEKRDSEAPDGGLRVLCFIRTVRPLMARLARIPLDVNTCEAWRGMRE